VHSPREAIISALREANRDILLERRKAGRKMGASVSVAYIRNRIMYFTHLGDSRIYSLLKGEINQLTRDHIVEEEPSPETPPERKPRPLKALTEGLGLHEDPEIEVKKYALREKDVILMTTDGLTNHVSDREILRISSKAKDLRSLCDQLIDAATRGGWEGNVTAGLLRIEKFYSFERKNIIFYSVSLLILLALSGGILFHFGKPKSQVKESPQIAQLPEKPPKEQKASREKKVVHERELGEKPIQALPKTVSPPAQKSPSSSKPQSSGTESAPIAEAGLRDEIMNFLTSWKEAWKKTAGAAGEMEPYVALYSETFSSQGLDKMGWAHDKNLKNKKKKWIKIELTGIHISDPAPGRPVEVRFSQIYRSSNYSSRSKKILLLEKEPGGWKIVTEKAG
ncbi:MAG: PP2C family serine/threonine-protein phosphatase, partial [Pseudomonadota bacterium]